MADTFNTKLIIMLKTRNFPPETDINICYMDKNSFSMLSCVMTGTLFWIYAVTGMATTTEFPTKQL